MQKFNASLFNERKGKEGPFSQRNFAQKNEEKKHVIQKT
jgi:hypothetical protein